MANHHLPALLVIMDGFGLAPQGADNAVAAASTPFIDSLYEKYPHTTLGASGEDVGLPDGQMGNSEVGHLNIGAGRIVFQELSRINNAIKDGSIKTNEVFTKTMDDVAASGKTLHLMGLMSPGGVHSMESHCEALVSMAAERGVKTVRVHCFMDGRDVDPQSGAGYVADLVDFLAKVSAETGCDARVATVEGRYWAMDRDNRWERVQLAYDAITKASDAESDPVEGIKAFYEKDPRGDEFVDPFVCHNEGVADGDAVIFFNFRPDRARQMTRAFTEEGFDGFDREVVPALSHFVTMTEYDPSFNVEVAFPKTFPENVLADVIAANGLKQLHTAETEKYAHVTFFLNGGIEEPKEGEERVLVASPKVATYDLKPEMSAPEVTEKLVAAINEDRADFYIVNFANCDMVGHTGVFDAAKAAVEAVDNALSQVIPAIQAKGGFALITADHGNADHMFDVVDGVEKPFTAHTTNRVPFIIVSDSAKLTGIEDGRLSDIAPTMLTMAGLEPSAEMTGRVLAVEE